MKTSVKNNSPKTMFVSETGSGMRFLSPSAEQSATLLPPSGPPGIYGPQQEEMAASPLVSIGEGTRIGQYEIIRELGRGGMGAVFLAKDNKLGREVAIKFLQVRNPDLTRRFIKEAQVTARCVHENIVVIHEVGEYEGSPFMVLEYVEGEALSVLRGAPQPMTHVVEIIVAVVRALARAHDAGIVHRDLKPENVLLGTAGTIKVLDFGIAKLLEKSPVGQSGPVNLNQTSLDQQAHKTGVAGTIGYMSPEQWGALPEIDHRTDIWSVGLMLYEFLSGVHPLMNREPLAAWVMQLEDPIPSLGKVARNLPRELVGVVDKCLAKHPDHRYANARDLLRALEPFLPGRYQPDVSKTASGPYAGLRTFQEEDAGRFFGRNAERADLLARLRDTALLAVVGPSGVGKSSFIRAGVIPALKSFEGWSVFTIRPGRHPMQTLAELCVRLLDPTTGESEHPGIEGVIRSRLITEPEVFSRLVHEYCNRERRRMLLLVDQFEELYTLSPHILERKALTSCLTGAANDAASPVRVVVTIRADFLGRVAEDANFLNELQRDGGLFFLGPPSAEGLREALVQPAEAAGYRFETESMVNEMVLFLEASPNGLPLLQFAASQLWDARDPVKRLLTEQSYRGIGGVSGALVSHADRVVSLFSEEQQAVCRQLFCHLITPERTRAVRNLQELGELIGNDAELTPLIDKLVASRLLVVQKHTNSAAVEIVHESLIITWPTLRRWLDASHEDSRFLDQLLNAARHWDANHRAAGLLWSGEMVDELKRFQRRYQGKLPAVAEAFVVEIGRQATRSKRMKQSLVVSAFAASLLLAAGASGAAFSINSARAKAVRSEQIAKENERRADANARLADQQRRAAEAALTAKIEEEQRRKTAEVKIQQQGQQLSQNEIELQRLLVLAQANANEAKSHAAVANEQRLAAEIAKREAQDGRSRALEAKNTAEDALKRFAARYGVPEDALRQ
ncbi:MAG: protein kinase domain-containing protein [Myxococcales bacterium]